jgi:hypothetical protein
MLTVTWDLYMLRMLGNAKTDDVFWNPGILFVHHPTGWFTHWLYFYKQLIFCNIMLILCKYCILLNSGFDAVTDPILLEIQEF